jgi:hypothetical protein
VALSARASGIITTEERQVVEIGHRTQSGMSNECVLWRPPRSRGVAATIPLPPIASQDSTRHARPGEAIQLYTGMRTKYCRRIGVAICRLASPITIDFQEPRISYTLDACLITVWPGKLDEFARGDGFADWPAMCAFWAKYHPELPVFAGWMIRWGEFHQSLDGGEGCEVRMMRTKTNLLDDQGSL